MHRLVTHWVRHFTAGSLPQLTYQPGSLSEQLLDECPHLRRRYDPPLWAKNRHVHLIISGVLRKLMMNPKYKRQLLTAPDGGIVALDWFHSSNKRARIAADAPIVLVLHALCGDSHDSFVKWMCLSFYKLGWRAVAYNYRGCGGAPLTTPRIFCQADTSDLYLAVKEIRAQFPDAALFLVGFSLGAYTINKYLGQVDSGVYGPEGKVTGAACLGSGYDFKAEMAHSASSKISYDTVILHYWKGYVHKHRRVLRRAPGVDLNAVKNARTLVELDEALACPMFGYKNVGELYDDSNGLVWIPRIKTPCLLISADDDPFLDHKAKPEEQCKESNCVMFCSTRYGSHCAHLSSWWPFQASWLDVAVPEYFRAVLRNAGYTNRGASEPLDDAELSSHSSGDGDPGDTDRLFKEPGLGTRSFSAGSLEHEALFRACIGPRSEGDAHSDNELSSDGARSEGDSPRADLNLPRLTI